MAKALDQVTPTTILPVMLVFCVQVVPSVEVYTFGVLFPIVIISPRSDECAAAW
jgi:hypothetical protein